MTVAVLDLADGAALCERYGLPVGGPQPDGRWIGFTAPRLFTPPLRELTDETTEGFEAIRFAENILKIKLLPWQKFWLIHALELLPDGTFRFRILLTLIARQNGKTFLLKIVALYFLYVLRVKLVLGCAQDLRIARESWDGAYDIAARIDDLRREFVINPRTRPGRRDGAGYEAIVLDPICPHDKPIAQCEVCPPGVEHGLPEREYRVSAATKSAGRGLTTDLLIMDEFRHCTSLAWAALSKTTTAVASALTLPISNAGTDESEVLNKIRESALAGDEESIGVLEWSGEDECPLDDADGNCHANPALGYGNLTERTLRGFRATDTPEVYRTESLCQRVTSLDTLFDPIAWKSGHDAHLSLAGLRPNVTAVFEVAPDGQHATLIAAGKFPDGKIGVDVQASWPANRMHKIPAELPKLIEKIKPRKFGWFPGGPAKQFGAMLRKLPNSEEIAGGRVSEACETLVGVVKTHRFLHADDTLLTTQTLDAQRLDTGDGFRIARKGVGHCDATYAAAGAVLLAESLPAIPLTSGVWVV